MIRVLPPAEPERFDLTIRQPGREWLAAHPGEKPRNLWCAILDDLALGFQNRCAYLAMWISDGTVDHYLCQTKHPDLAYEWSNYRYASARINSSKRDADDSLLDPFEVEDDWFELLLPSLQLVLTEAVPAAKRARAQYTLERLHLRDGEMAIRNRQAWYEMYQEGTPLELIERKAPHLARAIRKRQGQGHE